MKNTWIYCIACEREVLKRKSCKVHLRESVQSENSRVLWIVELDKSLSVTVKVEKVDDANVIQTGSFRAIAVPTAFKQTLDIRRLVLAMQQSSRHKHKHVQ